ncbi:chaperone modulator CbpM [Dyadobacter sediminis]|uniref:MerR family transcriptional regulator n=1 Tax=Dyadobacter sediminis TaxID=1493691 RepID=A0A5R9KJI8_9BACT|nr:chaperone modulator CbpM [Dyadobacter sediminis]TLU96344.1 hypothetical protein FEM55_04180 [Dyadobacter sediminis]GGB81461.1 hypothetical protein GCM10011325_06160 [Dyadobacter sediminis]
MENSQLIAIQTFCSSYNVEYSFIESLQRNGMIETVVVSETQFLHIPQLRKIERMIRLHHELDINLEGIEAIHTLLERIDVMEKEMTALKNRLRFFEPGL